MACSTTVTRAIGSVCLLNLTGRYRRLVAMTVRTCCKPRVTLDISNCGDGEVGTILR